MSLLITVRRYAGNAVIAALLLASGCDRSPLASDKEDWRSEGPGGEVSLRSVWGSSSEDVFVVGVGGMILHYDGNRWSEMNSGTTTNLYAVCGRTGEDVYAVGASSEVLHYDGTSWQPLDKAIQGTAYDVWTSPGQAVYVGSPNGVWVYDGSQWNLLEGSPLTHSLYGFAGRIHPAMPEVDLQLVATSGVSVSLWARGSWTYGRNLSVALPQDIWGPSCGQIFAVCSRGWIFNNVGNNEDRSRPVESNLRGVHGRSANNVYAVGSAGKIVHYDGEEWKELPSPVTSTLSGVWTASSGEVFVVGEQGTILHYNP